MRDLLTPFILPDEDPRSTQKRPEDRDQLWIHILVFLLALASLAFGMMPPAGAAEGSDDSDWSVAEDTVLTNETRIVNGTVDVQGNATLQLEGVDLRVGERIHVAENASLELGPVNGTATTVAPTTESEGFDMHVRGTLNVSGLPATQIRGLSGDGLLTMASPDGGLQVHGSAHLEDARIYNGSGPLLVHEGAHALLDNVTVQGLGELGVASMGHLVVNDSRVLDHKFGFFGRHDRTLGACLIEARDVVVGSSQTNVLLNACRFEGADATVHGGNLGFTLNGRSTVVLQGSQVSGYGEQGVTTQPLPNGRPRLNLQDVDLDPATNATHGFQLLQSPRAVLTNVTASSHEEAGVVAGGTNLTVASSTFENNGKYGIQSHGGALNLDSGNAFGSAEAGTANGEAAVKRLVRFPVVAQGPDEEFVAGLNLTVRPADGGTAVAEVGDAAAEPVRVEFETYEGRDTPRYVGPFVYEADHPRLESPQRGEVPEDGSALIVQVGAAEGGPAGSGPALSTPGPSPVGLVGAVLAVAAVVCGTRGWRAGRED